MLKNVEQNALNILKPQSGKTADATASRGPRTASSAYRGGAEDEVHIDSRSRLQNLAAAAVDGQRSARVDQLHALVQSGQYQFDPAALASAIVDGARKGD